MKFWRVGLLVLLLLLAMMILLVEIVFEENFVCGVGFF